MASERTNGPTPNGGAYMVAVYMRLADFVEVDKADADGMAITEYDADGNQLHETVARLTG